MNYYSMAGPDSRMPYGYPQESANLLHQQKFTANYPPGASSPGTEPTMAPTDNGMPSEGPVFASPPVSYEATSNGPSSYINNRQAGQPTTYPSHRNMTYSPAGTPSPVGKAQPESLAYANPETVGPAGNNIPSQPNTAPTADYNVSPPPGHPLPDQGEITFGQAMKSVTGTLGSPPDATAPANTGVFREDPRVDPHYQPRTVTQAAYPAPPTMQGQEPIPVSAAIPGLVSNVALRQDFSCSTVGIGPDNIPMQIQGIPYESPIVTRLCLYRIEQTAILQKDGDPSQRILYVAWISPAGGAVEMYLPEDQWDELSFLRKLRSLGINLSIRNKKLVAEDLLTVLIQRAKLEIVPAAYGWFNNNGVWSYVDHASKLKTWKEVIKKC